MDVQELRRLKPKLNKFLRNFDDCFGRKDTRSHLPVYITGQLSGAGCAARKSLWRRRPRPSFFRLPHNSLLDSQHFVSQTRLFPDFSTDTPTLRGLVA